MQLGDRARALGTGALDRLVAPQAEEESGACDQALTASSDRLLWNCARHNRSNSRSRSSAGKQRRQIDSHRDKKYYVKACKHRNNARDTSNKRINQACCSRQAY